MAVPLPSHFTLRDRESELDRILRDELIVSCYQPIVDLDSGETVGYEALARGPQGSILEFPDRLFEAGRVTGRLAELDWQCRAAALRGALANGLLAPMLLFVNVEPEAAFVRPPDSLRTLLIEAGRKLRVVCEFTERGLINRPADVLAAAQIWRKAGMSVAIDDVGADPTALAMLPFLRPEIIKLDLSLVQAENDLEIIHTLITVNAWAEHTGTIILAEGVETDAHLARARALGADYAQGWKYGRPIPLTDFEPANTADGAHLSMPTLRQFGHNSTPFRMISAHREPRIASKRMMLAFSHQLENVAKVMGETGVMISTFQWARFFNQQAQRQYRMIADQIALVGVIGADIVERPAGNVRGASISQDDPLVDEWVVCTISPHFSAALVARDLGDKGPEMDRRFSYCLTYDEELVASATQMMIERIAPLMDRTAPAAAANVTPLSPTRLRLAD